MKYKKTPYVASLHMRAIFHPKKKKRPVSHRPIANLSYMRHWLRKINDITKMKKKILSGYAFKQYQVSQIVLNIKAHRMFCKMWQWLKYLNYYEKVLLTLIWGASRMSIVGRPMHGPLRTTGSAHCPRPQILIIIATRNIINKEKVLAWIGEVGKQSTSSWSWLILFFSSTII